MVVALVSLIGLAGLVGVVLTAVARNFGRWAMLMDSAGARGHRKRELRRVPNVGGVAIAGTILLTIGGGLAATFLFRALLTQHLPTEMAVHLNGVRVQAPLAATVLACLGFLHVMGLVDDRRALGPWVKLAAMAAPCVALPLAFEEARLLTLLGPAASVVVTAVWLLAVTNALNFMDNMDGLAGSVAATCAAAMFVFACVSGQWFIAAYAAVLIGACLGFLVYNTPPATIFMGDGGSLVLGYSLGTLTVLTTYAALPAGETAGWLGAVPALFMPVAILAIPLYDLVSVCAIRIAQGKSPLVGDQQHFSHRLRNRGLGPDGVLAVVVGLTLLAAMSGLAMPFAPLGLTPVLAGQVVLAVAVLAFLERRAGGRATSERAGEEKNELAVERRS